MRPNSTRLGVVLVVFVVLLLCTVLSAVASARTTHSFRFSSERHRATRYAEREVEALERRAGATTVTLVPHQSYCQRVTDRPQIAQCIVITLTNRHTDPPVSHRTTWLWPVLISVQSRTGRLRLYNHPKPQWLEEPCTPSSTACEVVP